MSNKIKMITFDLDDTLWDNKPTITNAEIKTRKWIEDRVGAIEWGDLNDFLRRKSFKSPHSIAPTLSSIHFLVLISALVIVGLLSHSVSSRSKVIILILLLIFLLLDVLDHRF